ncbi:hypothetical protein H4219_005262, partial [Mycoemilia scoparia]
PTASAAAAAETTTTAATQEDFSEYDGDDYEEEYDDIPKRLYLCWNCNKYFDSVDALAKHDEYCFEHIN